MRTPFARGMHMPRPSSPGRSRTLSGAAERSANTERLHSMNQYYFHVGFAPPRE